MLPLPETTDFEKRNDYYPTITTIMEQSYSDEQIADIIRRYRQLMTEQQQLASQLKTINWTGSVEQLTAIFDGYKRYHQLAIQQQQLMSQLRGINLAKTIDQMATDFISFFQRCQQLATEQQKLLSLLESIKLEHELQL